MHHLDEDPYAYVRLYRVAPKTCSNKGKLAAIVACSKEVNTSGIGLEIGMSRSICFLHVYTPRGCTRCHRQYRTQEDRTKVARTIAKRFKLTIWRDAATNLYRPAYLHVHRGPSDKQHVKLAKAARKAAAKMLQKLGYEVRVTTDEGGTEVLRAGKRAA
jgi:hypothetical protein